MGPLSKWESPPDSVAMNIEKSLIIIDDEATLLQLLQDYLEQHNLRAFVYENVPDIENELKVKKPHAVLLDIIMPQVSGIDVLKKIKAINPKIPVIMMTGFADEEKRIESLRNGAYALLTKPFTNLEELYHTINNAMNHYIESIRTEELSVEVEERYKREKMNLLELDFLKNLQHMIGEMDDQGSVLRNVSVLLKNFLDFEYFAALLLQKNEVDIQIFPNPENNRELVGSIASALLKKLPSRRKDGKRKVILQGMVDELDFPANGSKKSMIIELSTAKKTYGYAGLFRDVSFNEREELIFGKFCSHIVLTLEKIRLFNEIRMLSIHDGLTGVFNHVYVLDEIDSEIERAKRYHVLFSIILLDIDNFKDINDSYGHLVGDFVLRGVAHLIEKTLRVIDVVGRYGGEEFIVILPQTDLESAVNAAERLRKAIELERFVYNDNNTVSLTVSLGVATYRNGQKTRDLVKIADDNLYKAKRGGKNKTCYEQQ